LLVLMRTHLTGLEEKKLLLSFIKALVAGTGMAAIILLLNSLIHLSSQVLNIGLSVAAGIASYALLLMILKTEELKRIYGMVRKRITRH
jgi:hypothetical protein